jgi:hypothetical protein
MMTTIWAFHHKHSFCLALCALFDTHKWSDEPLRENPSGVSLVRTWPLVNTTYNDKENAKTTQGDTRGPTRAGTGVPTARQPTLPDAGAWIAECLVLLGAGDQKAPCLRSSLYA